MTPDKLKVYQVQMAEAATKGIQELRLVILKPLE